MKKILNKKVLGVLLAVMMLFAMSAPAFANTPGTATISIWIDGELYFGDGGYDDALIATVSTGTTVKDAIDEYAMLLEPDWDVVAAYDPITRLQTTANALVSMMYAESPMAMGQDGLDILGDETEVTWSTSPYFEGWGLVSADEINNEVVYTYCYSAYAWTFGVNNVEYPIVLEEVDPTDPDAVIVPYMDQVVLNNGDTVELYYNLQVVYYQSTDGTIAATCTEY